jgi:hypothetical protein
MELVLASGWLAPLGQAAGFILAIYLFVSILLGLLLTAALMFGFAWIREKSELIKKLRPFVNELNRSLEASKRGEPLPEEMADNRLVQAVTQAPRVTANWPGAANAIEQKVEQGSDRVANAVIEFRARTAMVKGIARAFFLPQTMRPRRHIPVEQAIELEQRQVAGPQVAREPEPPIYEEEITIVQSSR